MGHQKLFRVFNLISRLRSPIGCSKSEIAADFQVDVRTIERYFNLIKDIGFQLIKKGDRFYIQEQVKSRLKYEDGIVFSLEEAALIKSCILNYSGNQPLKSEILQKLFALSELSEISEELYYIKNAGFISEIRTAIKEKRQVALINYHSLNSKTIEKRTVEPIQFIHYFKYLIAYEPASKQVKHFKVDRIENAQTLSKKWQYESQHQLNQTDIFDMSSSTRLNLSMLLSERAASLLMEEFPAAEPFVKRTKNNKYLFEHWIASVEGAGRFVLSLIDEIKIHQPLELQQYIQEKIKNYTNDTNCRKMGGVLKVK